MRLYDNALESNYEALKKLYPVWYRDVLEMDALWKALGPQLDDLQKELTQAVDNGFIWTANEPVITELEKFLYIPVNRSKPLVERKALVASFSIGSGHIGEQEIKEVVRVFTDGEIEVALVGGTIEVSVTREIADRFNLIDCLYILAKRLPAHLKLAFRDVLLPVRLVNENSFYFCGLDVYARFFNRGQTEPILLDGSRLLDGSWFLDQVYSGIAFRGFGFEASARTAGGLTASSVAFSPWGVCNACLSRLESFGAAQGLQNKLAVSYFSTGFTLEARNAYALNGSLTIDRMYLLDGSVRLDGSRKLNAEIIKEEI